MKILLLAGEESGLIYADRLKARLAGHEIRGYADYGFQTSDLAVMGFWPVLRRLGYFLGVRRTLMRAIDEWRPDVVCTIDYPGMNLKLAAYAKAKGVRTVHVVCPQVWAWKKGRIPKIEAALDHLCCFFPFEPQLFRPGFAEFVGHPLVEGFGARDPNAFEKGLVALLPGSRLGEIARNLPVMLAALAQLPAGVHAVIPAANAKAQAVINSILIRHPAPRTRCPASSAISIQLGGARELLLRAECAVVASGTATLEAALARCPTVLVYRVSALLAWFARRVIREIAHIGLVNIVWEKGGKVGAEPMPELLQGGFTAEAVAETLRPWLTDAAARRAAIARLESTVQTLGTGGDALARVAGRVVAYGQSTARSSGFVVHCGRSEMP
ncbi:MAG: lipid-A-disaccharide synthase [Kiritimatiellia bacterium]